MDGKTDEELATEKENRELDEAEEQDREKKNVRYFCRDCKGHNIDLDYYKDIHSDEIYEDHFCEDCGSHNVGTEEY